VGRLRIDVQESRDCTAELEKELRYAEEHAEVVAGLLVTYREGLAFHEDGQGGTRSDAISYEYRLVIELLEKEAGK
jgi:hypothetical protein